MRHRPRLPHLFILIPVLLVCAALAEPAAAQHCWPSSVALLVRDERGALIHPDELTGYTYTPIAPDSSDQRHDLEHRTDGRWDPRVPPGTHALHWWGRGRCRVYLDEVVLRRGDAVMRLRLNLRLDTNARPGPTEYLIDTPAFQPGTFELGLPLPPGELHRAAWVTAGRWRRLPDEAD
ncbi:MAG TPA: hypothetical protein VHG93_08710 [Longimicrobium sp.]|nr:hypothetical protein [Longimicrobium sp.]